LRLLPALKNKNAAESLPRLQDERLPEIDYTRGLASRQENSTSNKGQFEFSFIVSRLRKFKLTHHPTSWK